MTGGRPEKVGLLGGSFDPPHEGHLWMARRARELWALDAVWLLPAWRPPHKASEAITPYVHRAAMTTLLAAAEPWLSVCELERERGGPSYTLDTILDLKAAHGDSIEFHLILGGDSLDELDSWRQPERLCREVSVLVLAREGFRDEGIHPCRVDRGQLHPAESRRIRADFAAGGRPRWLTAPVADYIHRAGLYRAPSRDGGAS